jgi:hypothetical protein
MAICISAAIFSWKMVPETKGLSLESISGFWQKNDLKYNKRIER